MVTLPIYNRDGAEVGSYEIDLAELAPRISKQLLHDAVVMYQANRRQGTFKSKSRHDVAGTTKKMYRQKGTGNARAGSRRSPIRVGGGHAHAKNPRDFSYRLPKKALRVATRMALASRLKDNEVTLIDELTFNEPKTSQVAKILKALKIDGRLLVAVEHHDVNLYKSIRNLADVTVLPVAELNALAVLHPHRLLVTKGAMDALRASLAGQDARAESAPAAAAPGVDVAGQGAAS
jgi:large subunit ribosomal protein L4